MNAIESVRKAVLFLGFGDGDAFAPVGTAFILGYKDGVYLVTSHHIAIDLGSDPFHIRLNKVDGTSATVHIDPTAEGLRWYSLDANDKVDLAILPYHYRVDKREFDHLQIHEGMILDNQATKLWDIGVGDLCYVVGLFKLVAGKKRNLPIVHSGNIAAMPSDELIPVRDWIKKSENPIFVEGYLVECANLSGLSGSPVLVRPSVIVGENTVFEKYKVHAYAGGVFLLGIWQASWDAPINEVAAVERGSDGRIPVGMGIVVPTSKLIELLETKPVSDEREEYLKSLEVKLSSSPNIADFFREA